MQTSHAAEAFFTYARVDRMYAAETQTKIKDCFRSWILPAFGAREVESLAIMDILEFRRAMVDRRLSISRQYSLLVVLKLFLNFCRSVLKLAVMDAAEIRLPRRPQRRVEFLTDEEVNRLLLVVSAHHFTGLRLRVLLEVLLSTGMRISEALSLNRDAAETMSGEVEIVGKGNKPRTVFISPRCQGWMRRFLRFRRDAHLALFITTGKQPRRLTRNDMSKLFVRLRSKTGITKKLTPHLLRHTFCTSLLHHGADITFIKELAGHQDIQTTARYYLGVDKKALRQVLERCAIHGWSPQDEETARIPGSDEAQLWLPSGPDPDSSGTWSPAARAPGSL
jgi:integrase/recombinase XerD